MHADNHPLVLSNDEELLASLGYRQELRRDFKPWELFGIGFSMIAVFPSLSSVLLYAIPNGGTHAMVWGWGFCLIFLSIIGLALAELGSAAPTSGGLYYWTHTLSSPRYKNLLSWIVGYCNSLGLIALAASGVWSLAIQVSAAISIGTDMRFGPTTAQTFGIFAAFLVMQGLICSTAARYFARLQLFYIILNIALCIIVIVGLPVATPQNLKNPVKYAFKTFDNLSGWPDGFAIILSFLSPSWAIGIFDPGIHVSEEASNAATAVPWTILSSVFISGILGWAVNIALVFNMGTDLTSIIDNPIGQPMAAASILLNSFGKHKMLGIWVLVIIAQFMAGTSSLTVGSRQMFAFSRDGGFPLSGFLRRVNMHTHTPIYAVWAMVFTECLLGLLAFAGPGATSAIFSLGIVAEYIAYIVPISARYLGDNKFRKGPFHLGILSAPVAITAVVWMTFMIVILMFPNTPHPDTASMNYTVIVSGGVIILSVAYYYFPKFGGKHWFKGPVRTVQEDLQCTAAEEHLDAKWGTEPVVTVNDVDEDATDEKV